MTVIWIIFLYLLGLLVAWLLLAGINDSDEEKATQLSPDTSGWQLIFMSWVLVLILLVCILLEIMKISRKKVKAPQFIKYPSFKYFKK